MCVCVFAMRNCVFAGPLSFFCFFVCAIRFGKEEGGQMMKEAKERSEDRGKGREGRAREISAICIVTRFRDQLLTPSKSPPIFLPFSLLPLFHPFSLPLHDPSSFLSFLLSLLLPFTPRSLLLPHLPLSFSLPPSLSPLPPFSLPLPSPSFLSPLCLPSPSPPLPSSLRTASKRRDTDAS